MSACVCAGRLLEFATHDEYSTHALILPRSVISLGVESPCVHDECLLKLTVWRPAQKHFEFKFVSASDALKWVDAIDISADIWTRLSSCSSTGASDDLAVDAAPPSLVLSARPQHRRSMTFTAMASVASPKRFQTPTPASRSAAACNVPLRIQRSQSHAELAIDRVLGSPNFRPKPESEMCAKCHARSHTGIPHASKFEAASSANGCDLNTNPIALAAFQQSASVGAQFLDRESWTYALSTNQLANTGILAGAAVVMNRPASAVDLEIEIDTDSAAHTIHRDRDTDESLCGDRDLEAIRRHQNMHAHDHDQAAAVCFISSSGVVSPPVIFMLSPPPPPSPPASSPPSRHDDENHDHSNSATGLGELSPTGSLIEAFDFSIDSDGYFEPAEQVHVALQLQHGCAAMAQGSFVSDSSSTCTQMHVQARNKLHMHMHASQLQDFPAMLRSSDAENYSLKMVALHHNECTTRLLGFIRVHCACKLHELRQQILAQFKISHSFRFIAQQLPVDIRFESMALCGTLALCLFSRF